MNKINLIIGREYWTRVKSKMFLLTTFLAPIAIVVIYGVLIYLVTRGSDQIKNISIIDNAGITAVSYTHLRAHETKANLVCRLLLEKKK